MTNPKTAICPRCTKERELDLIDPKGGPCFRCFQEMYCGEGESPNNEMENKMKKCFNLANEIVGADLAPDSRPMQEQMGEWQCKALELATLVQKECNEFGQARDLMQKEFEANPDFRHTYVANISIMLLDQLGCSATDCNNVAEHLMDLVFKS